MNTLGFGLDHIVDFRRSDDTQFLPHVQVGSVELRQTDTLGFCLDRERTPGRKHDGVGRTPWASVWIKPSRKRGIAWIPPKTSKPGRKRGTASNEHLGLLLESRRGLQTPTGIVDFRHSRA